MKKDNITGQSRFRRVLQEKKDQLSKDFEHEICISKYALLFNLIKSTNYIILNQYPMNKQKLLINFIKSKGFILKNIDHVKGILGLTKTKLNYINPSTYDLYGGANRIEISFYPNPYKEVAHIQTIIKIYYPTELLYNTFRKFFQDSYSPVKVYEFEVTFDCFPEKLEIFEEIINQYLFKKYNRSKPKKYKNTYYLQDGYKTISIKSYEKENLEGFSDKNPFRFEVTLRRSKISKLKIEFDNLYQKLSEMDFQKFFEFKTFNQEEYNRINLVRYSRELKKRRKNEKRKGENKDYRFSIDQEASLLEQIIKKNLAPLLTEEYGNQKFTIAALYAELKCKPYRTKTGIKRYPKPIRQFFDQYTEFNDQFFSVINGGSFLL